MPILFVQQHENGVKHVTLAPEQENALCIQRRRNKNMSNTQLKSEHADVYFIHYNITEIATMKCLPQCHSININIGTRETNLRSRYASLVQIIVSFHEQQISAASC